MFDDFIRNDRIDRYNIMCAIIAHYSQQYTYSYYESSGGGRSIHNNATTAALKSLGEILISFNFWLKYFQHNYQEILILYHEAMIEFFFLIKI